MKYIITLALTLITISLFSQEKSLFDELYEFQNDKIKIYLDGVYKVIYKDCADYYMICKINNQLDFEDSVQIYDLQDRIVAKGYFQASRLTGNFISYFQNGKIESIGKYSSGLRIGIWKFYYSNEQLKKEIDFGDGTYYPILNSFYKMNGKQKVIDGNGKFKDFFTASISSTQGRKYQGKVQDGLFNGTWKVEANGTVIAKELFEKGKLIEGTSYSVMLGIEKYYNNPISTIFERNYLENVKIWGPSICPGNLTTLGLYASFFDNLQKILNDYVNESNRTWYFAEFRTDDKGYFDKVTIFPRNDILLEQLSNGFKNSELETVFATPFRGSEVIIIFFTENEIYFNKTDKIDNFILNFRY